MAVPDAVLRRLRGLTTPTICNAIETFGARPRTAGFMAAGLRSMYPDRPPLVGHAVTARISAVAPAAPGDPSRAAFWDHVLTIPSPRLVVMQDLDPVPTGAYWGEVQANIHRALGCVGVVTNGGVRDIDEVRDLDFGFIAACLLPSHAHVHIVDFGQPVTVGGLEVAPGTLLHADQHGVTTVPAAIAGEIDDAVARLSAREQDIIAACQARPFDLERLKAAST